MKTAHLALTAAYELAWKCGVIVIAIALLASMAPKDGNDAFSSLPASVPPKVVAVAEGGVVKVKMDMVEGSFFSNCSLVNEDGKELLLATYDRSGGLLVRWGEAYPIRPGCTITRDGRYQLTVRSDENYCQLKIRQDGPPSFEAHGPTIDDSHGLAVATDGELVDDPWLIESETAKPDPVGNQTAPARSGEAKTL